jgi:putative polyketide hydroxylase
VERAGAAVSTLDLVGRGFLLLAGPRGEAWGSAAQGAAEALGVDVDAYRVGSGGDLGDPDGGFAEVYGMGADGAVLVRPDGFIAWRTKEACDDAEAELADVLGRVLARS